MFMAIEGKGRSAPDPMEANFLATAAAFFGCIHTNTQRILCYHGIAQNGIRGRRRLTFAQSMEQSARRQLSQHRFEPILRPSTWSSTPHTPAAYSSPATSDSTAQKR
jgi:hypothetical protein